MANPYTVTLNIPTETTLYISADTYSGYVQQVEIVPQPPLVAETMSASGSGEGTRIGQWQMKVGRGAYQFKVLMQYNAGHGLQFSTNVQEVSISQGTYNQVSVVSEDGTDADNNDSVVTFLWFHAV